MAVAVVPGTLLVDDGGDARGIPRERFGVRLADPTEDYHCVRPYVRWEASQVGQHKQDL